MPPPQVLALQLDQAAQVPVYYASAIGRLLRLESWSASVLRVRVETYVFFLTPSWNGFLFENDFEL